MSKVSRDAFQNPAGGFCRNLLPLFFYCTLEVQLKRKGIAMRKPRSIRLREQRQRQADYRTRLKEKRAPTSMDLARVALHFLLTQADKKLKPEDYLHFRSDLCKRLENQGFENEAAKTLFDNLVEKYTGKDFAFRRKGHLLSDRDRAP